MAMSDKAKHQYLDRLYNRIIKAGQIATGIIVDCEQHTGAIFVHTGECDPQDSYDVTYCSPGYAQFTGEMFPQDNNIGIEFESVDADDNPVTINIPFTLSFDEERDVEAWRNAVERLYAKGKLFQSQLEES